MLPTIDHDTYWSRYHRARDGRWHDAVRLIGERHRLELPRPQRTARGRNVVLVAGSLVVKLVPPFWAHMWERERAALEIVRGRLSVATPHLVAAGEMDAWRYLVMERLEGESAGWRAEAANTARRLELCRLQGRLASEIHAVAAHPDMRWDWDSILAEADAALREGLADGSIRFPGHLADSVVEFVEDAGNLAGGGTFLHGDLSSINILWDGSGTASLVDWSDASAGPADHEFISPFFHQICGRADDLAAFWEGFGAVDGDADVVRHRIAARIILKYGSGLGDLLQTLDPVPATWEEFAVTITGL